MADPFNKQHTLIYIMANTKGIIIDLSMIFNKTGYIDINDKRKYSHNHHVKHITLIQSVDIPIKIGDYFLNDCINLISIDISKLINVIAIGNYFLCGCEKLTNFDTTKLTSLRFIGSNFLGWCEKLTKFDTTNLTSVVSIGSHFLCYCINLKNLNTEGLISLISIGSHFLCECEELINFDATKLTSLIYIDDIFLCGCNENLMITVDNSSDYLREKILETNYTIIKLCNKPIVHLVNDCVI